MYGSEDFERLFIRYKGEAYLGGESIQWYKDTRHKVVEVRIRQQM